MVSKDCFIHSFKLYYDSALCVNLIMLVYLFVLKKREFISIQPIGVSECNDNVS